MDTIEYMLSILLGFGLFLGLCLLLAMPWAIENDRKREKMCVELNGQIIHGVCIQKNAIIPLEVK